MKFGRWEIGQFGGALILLCGFLSKMFEASISTAVVIGTILGFMIIATCLLTEIVKNIKTGEIYTIEVQKVGLHVPGFVSISRSSSPFSYFCHLAVYIISAVYCSYYGFYYLFLFISDAFA